MSPNAWRNINVTISLEFFMPLSKQKEGVLYILISSEDVYNNILYQIK